MTTVPLEYAFEFLVHNSVHWKDDFAELLFQKVMMFTNPGLDFDPGLIIVSGENGRRIDLLTGADPQDEEFPLSVEYMSITQTTTRKNSGVVGVNYNPEYREWWSRWSEKGQRFTKVFPVSGFLKEGIGLDEAADLALQAAIAHRTAMVESGRASVRHSNVRIKNKALYDVNYSPDKDDKQEEKDEDQEEDKEDDGNYSPKEEDHEPSSPDVEPSCLASMEREAAFDMTVGSRRASYSKRTIARRPFNRVGQDKQTTEVSRFGQQSQTDSQADDHEERSPPNKRLRLSDQGGQAGPISDKPWDYIVHKFCCMLFNYA